ncbi:MAG: hypothetical protein ACRDOB_24300 [Streptosporangiaceae bacterium]
MPSAPASRATPWPIWPSPTMPRVLPSSPGLAPKAAPGFCPGAAAAGSSRAARYAGTRPSSSAASKVSALSATARLGTAGAVRITRRSRSPATSRNSW